MALNATRFRRQTDNVNIAADINANIAANATRGGRQAVSLSRTTSTTTSSINRQEEADTLTPEIDKW